MILLEAGYCGKYFKCQEGVDLYCDKIHKDCPKISLEFSDKDYTPSSKSWKLNIPSESELEVFYQNGYNILSSSTFEFTTYDNLEQFKLDVFQEITDYYKHLNKRMLFLYKKIDRSSITEFFGITITLQIAGVEFKDFFNITNVTFGTCTHPDKFIINPGLLDDVQIQLFSALNIPISDNMFEEHDLQSYQLYVVPFEYIDGYKITKEYYDLSEFGKEEPNKIIKREEFFLDTKNPNSKLVEKLKKLPRFYHTYEEMMDLRKKR